MKCINVSYAYTSLTPGAFLIRYNFHRKQEHGLRTIECRMLRTICGHTKEEVTSDKRKMHNGELHNSYCSPNIRAMKRKRIGWAGM
jgi:hypothetical protein